MLCVFVSDCMSIRVDLGSVHIMSYNSFVILK